MSHHIHVSSAQFQTMVTLNQPIRLQRVWKLISISMFGTELFEINFRTSEKFIFCWLARIATEFKQLVRCSLNWLDTYHQEMHDLESLGPHSSISEQ